MDEAPESVIRLVDVNLNRAGEGLRVIEDVARFYIGDARLALRLKAVRHRLRSSWRGRIDDLIDSRDSAGDGLRQGLTADEGVREDVAGLLAANFRRVAEAVRVLEDSAPLIADGPDPTLYKDVRFRLYDLESECAQLLRARGRAQEADRKFDPSFMAIVDSGTIGKFGPEELGRMLAAGGVTSIQLRDKSVGFASLLRVGGELLSVARSHGLTLLVDDRADLAWSLGCDGVHLGPDDMPVHTARKLLGPGSLIGFSVRDPEAAPAASSSGADYIGTGALARSPTVPDYPVTGLDGLRRVARSVALPVVAVGGIEPGMVADILAAGAAGIAVSSGLFAGDSPQESALLYRGEIDNYKASEEVD